MEAICKNCILPEYQEEKIINVKTCFVTLLGEYYFNHLPEEKQTDENLDLLWEAGIYLEKILKVCEGEK